MSKYRVGDVVWIHFPYENEYKTKQRPAIIIDEGGSGYTFMFLKCTTKDKSHIHKGLWVEYPSDSAYEMGFRQRTFIIIDQTFQLSEFAIVRKIGNCPIMEQIYELMGL